MAFHFHDAVETSHRHATVVHAVDARAKWILAVGAAVWIGLLPKGQEGWLVVLIVGLLLVGVAARVRPDTLLWRASAALPFVVIPGLLRWLTGGFVAAEFAAMAGRGFSSALVAALLVSVTDVSTLLHAASALGVPDILVHTTALIYRYLQVLRDRAAAMASSARARGYNTATPHRFAVGGNMIGALLLQSLDRADRVHAAMLARGYTGRFPTVDPPQWRLSDGVVVIVALGMGIGSLVWLR